MKKFITLALLFVSLINVNAKEERSPVIAHELFKAMHMSEKYAENIAKIVNMQTKNMPNGSALQDTFTEFYEEYIGWENIKGEVTKFYMEKFTDNELKELIAFYKTPVGQKAAVHFPAIRQKIELLSQKLVVPNVAKLHKMIRATLIELKKQEKPKTKIILESEK